MATLSLCTLLLLVFSHSIILINYQVQSADEEADLFKGINEYRTSLNLTTFKQNNKAACLADEIADQFKSQPCTNTTGSATVPGTENQFSNFPELLSKCSLNLTNTRDGAIMPACVPDLDPSLVLTNFTKTQYSGQLNNTQYDGAGIGSEGNWIVVILTTNSSSGSFETAADTTSSSFVTNPAICFQLMLFLIGSILLL